MPSTRDEQLVERARRGDRAATRLLVERHLPLVRRLASAYLDLGLPFDDLVQEGSIGLLEAIDRFEPDRGAAFSTFAYWCVRKTITHALTEKGHVVRIPKRLLERRHRLTVASRGLARCTGHEPSPAELAAATGLKRAAVTEALQVPLTVASLDQAVGDDGTTRAALLGDPAARDPADEAVAHELRERIDDAVAGLPPDEQAVIQRHYGLEGRPQPLTEIAGDLGCSRHRARAIEDRALFRLARALKAKSVSRVGGLLVLLVMKVAVLLEQVTSSAPQ